MADPLNSPRFPQRRQFLTSAAAAAASVSLSAPLGAMTTSPTAEKKGFCTVLRDEAWRDKLTALNPAWFYTWGASIPDNSPDSMSFMPMLWGWYGENSKQTLNQIKTWGEQGRVQALMGFNEPDQHDQSNLTVATALDAWPQLMDVGLPLTSPGCVHPDREWMKEFMKGVEERELRVDAVCVHSYGGPSATGLMARLQRIYEMFGRPLWITEFAVGDWKCKSVQENRHRPDAIAGFMKEILPRLDEAKFVQRYSWFSAAPTNRALGTSALFDGTGQLTPLGKIYRAHKRS